MNNKLNDGKFDLISSCEQLNERVKCNFCGQEMCFEGCKEAVEHKEAIKKKEDDGLIIDSWFCSWCDTKSTFDFKCPKCDGASFYKDRKEWISERIWYKPWTWKKGHWISIWDER